MKCLQCKKEIVYEYKAILVTCDGDFACSEECKKKWEQERDRFFNEVIHDDKKFEEWMNG